MGCHWSSASDNPLSFLFARGRLLRGATGQQKVNREERDNP